MNSLFCRLGFVSLLVTLLVGAKGGCGEGSVSPAQNLCEESGGTWDASKCPKACWPPACGQSVDPSCTKECGKAPVCQCPASAPYWVDGQGCQTLAQCSANDPVKPLCTATGGAWDDGACPKACSPPACGQSLDSTCPSTCGTKAVCRCPASAPFWKEGVGCWSKAKCEESCKGTATLCSATAACTQEGCGKDKCTIPKTCTGQRWLSKTCYKADRCYRAKTCTEAKQCLRPKTCTEDKRCYQAKTCTEDKRCYQAKTCTNAKQCYKSKTCYDFATDKTYDCGYYEDCSTTYECGYYYDCGRTYDCGYYYDCGRSYDCSYYEACNRTYDCGYYEDCQKSYDCGNYESYTYDCSYLEECGDCKGTPKACAQYATPAACAKQEGCGWK